MTAPRLAWLAGKDGLGHAQPRARALRTACGARAIDERHAWPIQRRCEACVTATENEVATQATR